MDATRLTLTKFGRVGWDIPQGVPMLLEGPPATSVLSVEVARPAPVRSPLKLLPALDGTLAICARDGQVAILDASGAWQSSFHMPADAVAHCWHTKGRLCSLSPDGGKGMRLDEWQVGTAAPLRSSPIPPDADVWEWGLVGGAGSTYVLRRRADGWTVARWEPDGSLRPLPSTRRLSVAPVLLPDGRLFAFTPVTDGQEGLQLKDDTWQLLSGKRFQPGTSLQRVVTVDARGRVWTQGGAALSLFAADGHLLEDLRIFNLAPAADGQLYLNTLVTTSGVQEAGYRVTAPDGRLGPATSFQFPAAVLAQRDLRNAYLVAASPQLVWESYDHLKQSVLTTYDPASGKILDEVTAPDDYLARVHKLQTLHSAVADAQGRILLAVAGPEGLEIFRLAAD